MEELVSRLIKKTHVGAEILLQISTEHILTGDLIRLATLIAVLVPTALARTVEI
jgi:hypothetical protein